MKKLVGFLTLLLILAAPAISAAATFRNGDHASVNSSETVNDNLYIAGSTVTSAGSVSGDLSAAGGTVVVSGPVGADLAAAGGNITVVSPITGDARVAGGSVTIESSVGGDLIAAGGQITVGGEGIKGDVAIMGGKVTLDAPVAKTLQIRGNDVYINAPITGKVTVTANTLTLGKNAVISGDLTYTAAKELTKEPGATITGQVHFQPKPIEQKTPSVVKAGALAAFFSFVALGKFVMLLVCAMVVGLLLKRYSAEVVARARTHPFLEIGRGLVIAITLPVISVLLLITIIAVPFGILGLIGFAAMIILSWIFAPIVIGAAVYGYFAKKSWEVSWRTILLGVIIYSILSFIPFIGWLVQFLVALLVIGAAGALKFEILKQWK